ncbi:MAG TPA: quinone-interacting membrane-bound oxidoreductase complex subunit QmoC [Anaeromyxobacter sp.]|nr:quinone-interacting membrane-bound oxidoreductase complex subunit QmoC [Anaeromyxobacter sp.]
MAPSATVLSPARGFRAELLRRGGGDAARCFQCATCSSVCDLTTSESAFPRRQMLWAQWGLADRLAGDPSIWLCHQCNDCTARCPRDASPGDAMQVIRALVIEHLGAPGFVARLVGRARTTWPVLLGAPIVFWALYIGLVSGFAVPRTPLVYADLVPVWMIYSVFLPAGAFTLLAAFVGARRTWRAWGEASPRSGGLLAGLAGIVADVLVHRRFQRCEAARPRKNGHLLLLWGFLGALLTTTLLGIQMDVFGLKTPLPQGHYIKLIGNASAVLLVVGLALLVANRTRGQGAGRTRAFDAFFLTLVAMVVLSGVGAELGRLFLPPAAALALYVVHLGTVLSLFLTFPFSKFAHALYRTLAMAHERLASERRPS